MLFHSLTHPCPLAGTGTTPRPARGARSTGTWPTRSRPARRWRPRHPGCWPGDGGGLCGSVWGRFRGVGGCWPVVLFWMGGWVDAAVAAPTSRLLAWCLFVLDGRWCVGFRGVFCFVLDGWVGGLIGGWEAAGLIICFGGWWVDWGVVVCGVASISFPFTSCLLPSITISVLTGVRPTHPPTHPPDDAVGFDLTYFEDQNSYVSPSFLPKTPPFPPPPTSESVWVWGCIK